MMSVDKDVLLPVDVSLKADHTHLEQTFQRVLAKLQADDRDAIREAWLVLDGELEDHLKAEEHFILPEFQKSHPLEAERIKHEHKEIRGALEQLGIELDLHTLREDRAAGFIAALQKHAKNEEAVFYPWAHAHLGEPLRRSLGERLRSAVGHLAGSNGTSKKLR